MGHIAKLTGEVSIRDTPIAREMRNFIHLIGFVAIALGVVFFAVCISIGYGLLEALVFLIGIIVANVPEGIVATVTVRVFYSSVTKRFSPPFRFASRLQRKK